MHTQKVSSLLWLGMHANIYVICCVLMGSLYIQLVMGEFPCPLCMLQRMSMMFCALGQAFILSRITADGHLSHKDFMLGNAMTLLAALAGACYAIRQILLHIVPPDPGYGSAILGLHLYTWALLVFCAEIIAVAVNLLLVPRGEFSISRKRRIWTKGLFFFFALVITAFAVATFVEEGFHLVLPDDPVSNRLFEDLGLTNSNTIP